LKLQNATSVACVVAEVVPVAGEEVLAWLAEAFD
jgi:hypothetical protein